MKKKAAQSAKTQTLSTSEARANFAEALGMAQEENTVIGFDRYGKLVAAVVPIDAVRMLAGCGEDVDPVIRGKIERMSRNFMHVLPGRDAPAPDVVKEKRSASEGKPKEKRKRRKDKREKKKKAKAAARKRPRRLTRKI